jgi:predicted nuclease of predicted toxin-antitoxin system
VRFLVDAQLPPALARNLEGAGHEAEHVNEIGLAVGTDLAIWRHAARTGAVIVSKDEDFVLLARLKPSGPQVVWVRLGNTTNEALWRALGPRLREIATALAEGERLIEIV